MKRFFLIILLFSLTKLIANENLEVHKDFYFDIYFQYPNVKKEKYMGCGSLINNVFVLNTEVSYTFIREMSKSVLNDRIVFNFLKSSFRVLGNPSFRDYKLAARYSFSLSKSDISTFSKRSNSDLQNKIIIKSTDFLINESPMIIICDNLRIREVPDTNGSTKILGKLKKWDKVTAIDCTDTKDRIENLEAPWYKIRLEDGTEGWVFGGFAKIYFDDDDLRLLYKAFEKEGSEYTNQFPTPDES